MRRLIVAFFVVWAVAANAFADPIPVGSDSFTAVAADVTVSIPADFFSPGSDPFIGSVMLGGSGGMDTIIQRMEPAFPLPVPGTDTVPIELLQLHLQSVAPIAVTYGGGSLEQWNVMVALDSLQPSLGSMTINHTNPEGGTFSSFFHVFAVIKFTPSIPSSLTRSLVIEDTLGGNCTWTHAPPTGFLTGSDFYPGGVPGFPDQLNHLLYNGGQLDIELALISEPSTSILLISGFFTASGLFFFYRKKR